MIYVRYFKGLYLMKKFALSFLMITLGIFSDTEAMQESFQRSFQQSFQQQNVVQRLSLQLQRVQASKVLEDMPIKNFKNNEEKSLQKIVLESFKFFQNISDNKILSLTEINDYIAAINNINDCTETEYGLWMYSYPKIIDSKTYDVGANRFKLSGKCTVVKNTLALTIESLLTLLTSNSKEQIIAISTEIQDMKTQENTMKEYQKKRSYILKSQNDDNAKEEELMALFQTKPLILNADSLEQTIKDRTQKVEELKKDLQNLDDEIRNVTNLFTNNLGELKIYFDDKKTEVNEKIKIAKEQDAKTIEDKNNQIEILKKEIEKIQQNQQYSDIKFDLN